MGKWLLDFDSVTADLDGSLHRAANERFGTVYDPSMVHSWNWWWTDTPKEHCDYVWGPECFGSRDWTLRLPPVPGAVSGVQALLSRGHDLVVVSDRPPHMQEWLVAWLRRYGLSLPVVTTKGSGETKADVARRLGLGWVIEDSPFNAFNLALTEGVERVILLTRPYNRCVPNLPRLTRCDDWLAVIAVANEPTSTSEQGRCLCGCGREVRGRFYKGHNGRQPLQERLWSKVLLGGPNQCWEWQAARCEKGYGQLKVGGSMRRVNRVLLELTLDRPLGIGLQALHSCDNPPCCNPAHLYEGTPSQNTKDMWDRGRAPTLVQGAAGYRPVRLSVEKVSGMTALHLTGVPIRDLASRFEVHPNTVRRAVSGSTWRQTSASCRLAEGKQ